MATTCGFSTARGLRAHRVTVLILLLPQYMRSPEAHMKEPEQPPATQTSRVPSSAWVTPHRPMPPSEGGSIVKSHEQQCDMRLSRFTRVLRGPSARHSGQPEHIWSTHRSRLMGCFRWISLVSPAAGCGPMRQMCAWHCSQPLHV